MGQEGQVVDLSSGSPCEMGFRFKGCRTPHRRESSSEGGAPENRKCDVGGSSPLWRFVPSATPARMLGRGGLVGKEGSSSILSEAQQDQEQQQQQQQQSESQSGSLGPGTESTSELPGVNSSSCNSENVSNSVMKPPGSECWVHEECL